MATLALIAALLAPAATSQLIVDVRPRDARVTVDGKSVKAGKPVKLAPGEHRLTVAREGYRTHRAKVRLGKGEKRIEVRLRPAEPEPDLAPWAIGAWVVGGVALVSGIITGAAAGSAADDFNKSRDFDEKLSLRDDPAPLAAAANVLYGVGATAIVAGVLLWVLDPDDARTAQIAPLQGGGAYVGLGGAF